MQIYNYWLTMRTYDNKSKCLQRTLVGTARLVLIDLVTNSNSLNFENAKFKTQSYEG